MPTPISIYSASQISAIVNLNPYITQRHAWQKIQEILEPGFNARKGYKLPPFPDSPPIRWGNAFEDSIIKLAEEKEQLPIVLREKVFPKQVGDILLSCHIDGMFSTGTDRIKILHEGKSTWNRAFYSSMGEDVELIKDETSGIFTQPKRIWGEPGTDQVPEQYQVQAAIQRLCTGADLVKLSVLVFPKSTTDYEKLGWEVEEVTFGTATGYVLKNKNTGLVALTDSWAKPWAEQGQFHTYNLPRHEKLETALIKKIQEFDARYLKTKTPPPPTDYQDIRRLITNPIGTIIPEKDDPIIAKIREHSDLKVQMGSKSPHIQRIEKLKVEICEYMENTVKNPGADPYDKTVILDPVGGKWIAKLTKHQFRTFTG